MSNDYFNPPNSIWPNGLKKDDEDYVIFYPLGTNKINVPTSSSEWPKGDTLVSPFVYQDDKLVGFVDTKALTTISQTTIYLPYEHIEADFSAINKGQLQIHAPNATTKKSSWKDSEKEDIPEAQFKYKGCTTVDNVKTVDANYQTTDIVNGTWSEPLWDLEQGWDGNLYKGLFASCSQLTSFFSDLPSLTDGDYMFYSCYNLTTFNSDLPSLTDGWAMFTGCKLTSFSSDLPRLTDGYKMFASCDLTSFSSDLPSLTNGSYMFNGTKLTSFNSDLSSLTNGEYMFCGCPQLTSFSSNLSSLTNGEYMFYSCKLDTASVQNIADTINNVTELEANGEVTKIIDIHIGNSEPNEQEEAAFNKMASKGWTVYVKGSSGSSSQWNPTSLIPIDGEETVAPIPFWAKPVQSDEEHAKYVDKQGNFFNIVGAQFIYGDDLSTYGMFTCEEDAAANMRLTPYIKPQTEIENQ